VHDAGATLADWGRSKLEPLPPRSATPVIFDLPPPPFDGFEAEAPVDYPVIKVQFQSLGYGNLSDTRLETLKLFLGFAHKEFCLRPELLLPLRRGSIPMVGGSLSQPFIGADFKATIIMGFSKFVTCRICNEEHLGKMGMRHAASKHVPTEAMLEGRDQACEGQFDLGAIHGLLSPKAQQQLESFNRWLVSDKAKRAFQNLEDSSSVVCIKQEALLYMFVGSCFPFVKFIEAKQGKSAIKLCFYAKLPQDIGWGSSDIKKGYFLKKDHRSQFVRIILGYSPVNPELHFFSCYPIPESVFLLTARQFHLEVD
jgi:hypothetical protein